MSVSYGMITITDTTDLGQLSVYLTGSTVRQQVYDGNTNPVTYYPNWELSTGTPLVITPHVYFNGHSESLTSNKIEVSWSKTEGNITYPNQNVPTFPTSPTSSTCPESATGTSNKELQRPANLNINSTGASYTATITYYPIDGDRTITLQAIATLDLTISNNGTDGADGSQGAPAKALQLIGTGNYFTYHYEGTLFGTPTITLTAQSQNINGIHWYCDNKAIKIINNEKVTDNTLPGYSSAPYYTETSLVVAGNNTTGESWIQDLVPSFRTNRSAQIKVVEVDSGGNEVSGGLIDYMSIYGLTEAAPGTDTYSASLSNDEETIVDYEGTPILDNANTELFISQGGIDDLENWHITVTDSINNTQNFNYELTNSKDATGLSTNLNKYGPDRVKVTVMNTSVLNAAKITFTAVHGTYDGNTFTPDGEVSNIIKEFSLIKSSALVSHSLRLDAVNANRAADSNTYTPSIITVDAITRRGGSTQPYRNAGVIKAKVYYTDGTSKDTYESNTNDSPLQLTLSTLAGSKVISYIDTFLGGTSGNNYSDAEDKQKITISINGTNGINGSPGESPWSFILGNQFDSISTDFSNRTSQSFVIKIPVQAVEGTTNRTIYKTGSTNYPTVYGADLTYTTSQGTIGTISPKYYKGESEVITTGEVDNIRYEIAAGTNIGGSNSSTIATGSIDLTLTYKANTSLIQTYTYKAQPEALKPIRVILTPSPTDTFENQSGTIQITPTVLSGTSSVTEGWGSPTWEAYINGTWNSATAITGITINNNIIEIPGTAVDGYLALRFTVTITKAGITETYTEYVNLKDIDDPLQVTLHSTVGEQIINSQGIGVIYARVIRRGDNESYDTIVPDNMLAVGTTAPTSSTASGKTGYCYVVLDNSNPPKPTGEVRYYWRSSGSGVWNGYRGTTNNEYKYNYSWTFRDSQNNPYTITSNTPAAISYLLETNSQTQKPIHNQQFVYIDSSVINDKITAVVKVEL